MCMCIHIYIYIFKAVADSAPECCLQRQLSNDAILKSVSNGLGSKIKQSSLPHAFLSSTRWISKNICLLGRDNTNGGLLAPATARLL